MSEKIYVVVRNYDNDETSVVCFKDKDKAKKYAIQMAKEDHEDFEFKENFENCCCDIDDAMDIYDSTIIWRYWCKNIIIELLETVLK